MNEPKKKKRRRRQKNKGPKNKIEVKEKSVPKCVECGYRIRGKNHEQGSHHKNGSGGRRKTAKAWGK